jgi:signal transduction histidine kinase
MPRAIQSTFFEPLIHGLDVMLAKAERVMTGERANPDLDLLAVSHHRDLVNLPGVAEQVAAQCENAALARSVHLFVDVAPDALVIGDSVDLHRVVEQLVSSVLEGTPDRGCVTISGTVAHGVVTLTFSSHHPNRQGAATPPGLNFYPSEVGRILRTHGGRLELSNQPGHGARFEVRLPVG